MGRALFVWNSTSLVWVARWVQLNCISCLIPKFRLGSMFVTGRGALLVLRNAWFRHKKLLYLVMAGRLFRMVSPMVVCRGVPVVSWVVHSLGQLFGRQSLLTPLGRVALVSGSKKYSLVLPLCSVLSALVQAK